ncbi:MAG: DUF2207 domain-containing protein, partial [Clostridia bacterium]|nr:DUF2207 domain-containing protein [Clostridia bacterium]
MTQRQQFKEEAERKERWRMKRHTILPFIMGFFLMIFILPGQKAMGSEGYYDVTEFNIDVQILENGDAVVMEEITYDFDGDFNGIYRDIDYTRTSGLKDLTVGVLEGGNIIYFDESTGSGTYVYELEDTGELAKLKIYEPSYDEQKTFYIGYTLVNVAERYNDIGIFNRKIIDKRWSVPLSDITIEITIPEGAAKEDLKVYAHGPLTGESTIVDERTFRFTVPSVNYEFVETLAIFPPELIPSSTNVFQNDELQNILENEQRLADEANERREEAIRELEAKEKREAREKASRPVFLGAIAAAIGAVLFMFRKFT